MKYESARLAAHTSDATAPGRLAPRHRAPKDLDWSAMTSSKAFLLLTTAPRNMAFGCQQHCKPFLEAQGHHWTFNFQRPSSSAPTTS